MASIKEVVSIIDGTPCDQALLLKGIHGVGKSESIKKYMEDRGYRMVTLFLGQAADAGDIIGLPTRTEKVVKDDKGNIIDTFQITDFAPPKWWPTDMSEKVVIFLDEINRGKPEIMQCVMDMVLNRKLSGRELPKETRIIAAMNPIDDGYYQVEELDPALLDRFNVYDFRPTVDEWLEWANDCKVNPIVTTFIGKYNDHLDPPNSKDAKSGEVYPSRRSWKRVSDIINTNPKLTEGNRKGLLNILIGVIGTRSATALDKHIREMGSGLTVKLILEDWDEKVEEKVKTMQIQEAIHMNTQITYWLDEKIDKLKKNKEYTTKICKNLEYYVSAINVECQAGFFGMIAEATTKNKEWPRIVVVSNKNIGTKFMETLRGKKQ
jgi:hypothetical protein